MSRESLEGSTLFLGRLLRNEDLCTHRDQVEQIDDVAVAHAHTAMTGRGAQEAFPIGAVNVDVARFGVFVFGVCPFQPEDAGLHMIPPLALDPLASGGDAPHEDFPFGRALADAFTDEELAGGGSEATGFETGSELGSRNGVATEEGFVFGEKVEGLGGNVNADLHLREERIISGPFL